MKPGWLSTYTDLECALMVLLGVYGNGAARRQALGERYADVQALVEQMLASDQIPDGSGADPAAVQKALMQVFYDSIEQITQQVIERL